eukprot:CCRYP_012040-RA/>CCRYP_012040-RA protein AED:0.26 eAED:0.26 QI:0/0/0/1/1/1/2/0/686
MRRLHARQQKRAQTTADHQLLDQHITWVEDECTAAAKANILHPRRRAIENAHTRTRKPTVTLLQASKNTGYTLATNIRRTLRKCLPSAHQVTFQAQAQVRYFHPNNNEPMTTYVSGADGHYLSEADRHLSNLPILQPSTKRVGVVNGSTSMGKHATTPPFPLLSQTAAAADSFDDFPTSLMSVGKTSDDGTISIFTKDGVTIHKEQDVLITCHGKPLLIGVPHTASPTLRPMATTDPLQKGAHSPQPSTQCAIKWMHAVCGYPVKSTWLKAVQAGNFIGWPLLTAKNVQKYYPDSAETPQGHLNQTRKNVRSTKPKPAPFEEIHSNQLRGRKVHDIYTTTYQVRDTIFTNQTGRFPVRSQAGNKYIMVMVEIDSSAILVEPIKNRTDAELTRTYSALMLRLRRAGIVPRKHVLDNEISAAMKDLIQDTYKMSLKLIPPGCHRRNAAKVAIRNFKLHFLSVLAGVADDFPLKLWDKLLPQTKITLNLLRQSNATPTVSAYAHLNGHFDYNKMPLAPTGCNAQVHEKTDLRGTWAFHSVDGWYISTYPEHYRMHRCHIKSTNSDRLSDTVHFHHKHITNPTLTPADKLMAAIADSSRALLTHAPPTGASNLHQLQELLQQTSTQLNSAGPPQPQHNTPHPPRRVAQQIEQPPPRVLDPNMRVTRSMTTPLPAVPPMPIPPAPRHSPPR